MGRRRKKTKDPRVEEGRVRVHDPFELIRWLALSQPDPRKALAELVQNSLDAGAKHVRISRIREKKIPCLKIVDDGEGVIPELDRRDALRYVATHIGHSRKRDLSPQQRLELMTQGQYGIGLLGFWSLGQMLEIRSSIPGQEPHRLVLFRNRPEFELGPLRGKLAFDERFTEVVVVGLDPEAMSSLGARRAADYLASELRGQLLSRDVTVVVEDKLARGRAPRSLRVRPPRFLGERLDELTVIEIPGRAPIRLEIYLAGENGEAGSLPPLALYAAGTVVAESFHDLAALGLDHPPWTDRRLTGLVDFAELQVAPGSRRGVVPDGRARDFAQALAGVEPVLERILETKERERAAELDRNAIRDLRRAFRDFYKKRPRYTMLPTATKRPGAGDGASGEPASSAPSEADAAPIAESGEAVEELFPPGPLAAVTIEPMKLVVEVNAEKRARASALDASGRPIRDGVRYTWQLFGRVGQLSSNEGQRVALVASEEPSEGILSVLAGEASSGEEASVAVPVEVVESLLSSSDEGFPDPELIDAPGARWRSRFHDERWQVNTGHPDYKANSTRPALKLRYLAMLFSKEVVLRSSQDPRLDEPLEQMVEVAAYADRHLTERPPSGRRGLRSRPPSEERG